MRIPTHILMLGGLLLAAACSRSTSSDSPRPAPRPEPPILPPPSSTGGSSDNDGQPSTERPGSTAARLGIPPGHLPEIGQCRIWAPGVPPGQQRWAKSVSCLVVGNPPAGHWLLFRPTSDRRIVRVRVAHERRSGVITVVRVYRISNGEWVRDIRPEHEPRDQELYHVRPDTSANSEPTIVRPPPRRIVVRPREDSTPPPRRDTTQVGRDTTQGRRDTTQIRRDTTRQRPDNPFDRRDPPPAPPPPPPPAGPPAPPPPPPPPLDLRPLNIPPGHLPEDGECRVWIPGTVPGQQPRPKSRPCAGIESAAPAGSWILYMPANDKDVVHVRVVDARRAGVVVVVRIYDVHSNQLIREVSP
jgi:hypothetical protein